MNLKELVGVGILGGLSVLLSYFIDPFFQPYAVGSLVGFCIIGCLYRLIVGSFPMRLQLSPTRRPEGSDTNVDLSDNAIFYYTFGVVAASVVVFL
jgi:hypothetical protein